jgi:PAS domain S-box-containing protein
MSGRNDRDHTKSQQADDALRALEERLTLAQTAAGVGTWDWDLTTNQAHVSGQYFRLYGLESSERRPNYDDWLRRLHPGDRERATGEVQAALQNIRPYNTEFRVVWPDGSVHWLTSRGTVLFDETGKAIRMIGAHVDITARKQSEAELERAKRAAETANIAKSEFLANMSHEIRTPMAVILGYADMLLEGETSSERIERLDIIKRNGQHLLQLMNDILDLSKIEADRLEIRETPLSPTQVASEVHSFMSMRAAEKGLDLLLECPDPIPHMITFDPMRLRQILINLVGNAIKFTERGRVRLVVRIVGPEDAPAVCFEVIDTGIGMTDDEVSRVFEPFWQVDGSSTRRFGGTGLGLSICKRLCDLMGATIEVESKAGSGTAFRVLITGESARV